MPYIKVGTKWFDVKDCYEVEQLISLIDKKINQLTNIVLDINYTSNHSEKISKKSNQILNEMANILSGINSGLNNMNKTGKITKWSEENRWELNHNICMYKNAEIVLDSIEYLQNNLKEFEDFLYSCNIEEIKSKWLEAREKLEEKLKELDIDSNTIERFNDVVYDGKNVQRGEADVYAKIMKLLCDDNIAKCVQNIHVLYALAKTVKKAPRARDGAGRDIIYAHAGNFLDSFLMEVSLSVENYIQHCQWDLRAITPKYFSYLEIREQLVKHIEDLNRYIKPSSRGTDTLRFGLDGFSVWEDESWIRIDKNHKVSKVSSTKVESRTSDKNIVWQKANKLSRDYKWYKACLYGAMFFLLLGHYNVGFLYGSAFPYFSLKTFGANALTMLSVMGGSYLFRVLELQLRDNRRLRYMAVILLGFSYCFCIGSYFLGILGTSYLQHIIIQAVLSAFELFTFMHLFKVSFDDMSRSDFYQNFLKRNRRKSKYYKKFVTVILSILGIIPFFLRSVAPSVLYNYNLILFPGVGLGVYGYLSLTTPLLALASASISAYSLGKIMASYVHYVQNSFAKRHEEFKGLTTIQNVWLRLKIIMMSCITYFSAGRIAYSGQSSQDLKLTLVKNRSFKNILPNGSIHPTLITDVTMVSLSFAVLSFLPGLSVLSQLLIATLPVALASNVLAVISPRKMRITKPGKGAVLSGMFKDKRKKSNLAENSKHAKIGKANKEHRIVVCVPK